MNIAINGFGRIGKTFLRTILLDEHAAKNIDIKTINIGKGSFDLIAHSFKYDSTMGTFPGDVHTEGNMLCVGNKKIELIAELDPQNIKWAQRSIDWVVDASGHFTKRDKAMLHIEPSGAGHVLITAPATNPDVTIVPGINSKAYDNKKHRIVSLGSCTTNAVIPMLKVIDNTFAIQQCSMTTIHAYTNNQVLLDIATDDPRRSRAAALNIIPTTTGVSKVVDEVLPGMGARFSGMSVRVPVAKVSLIDLVFTSNQELTIDKINVTLKNASLGEYSSIMGYTNEPLVSSDFSNNPYSVTIDSLLTQAQVHMGHVFGWYDNEWGYCQRLKDFLLDVA
jgi:Glyceraldehyde-3-phosphate dehydrogenase/erythrose-4-phosphate dehydrogenase